MIDHIKCPRCKGCGKIAFPPGAVEVNDDAWSTWESSELALGQVGRIFPMVCPLCLGDGEVEYREAENA